MSSDIIGIRTKKDDSTRELLKQLKEKGINLQYKELFYARRFADKYPEGEKFIELTFGANT